MKAFNLSISRAGLDAELMVVSPFIVVLSDFKSSLKSEVEGSMQTMPQIFLLTHLRVKEVPLDGT
jgi:hypothetical protein